jgi:hypothetical protein
MFSQRDKTILDPKQKFSRILLEQRFENSKKYLTCESKLVETKTM